MSVNPYDTKDEKPSDLMDGAEAPADLSAEVPASPPGSRRSSYRRQMNRANILLVVLFAGGLGSVYFLSLRKLPNEANAEERVAEIQVDNLILRLGQRSGAGAGARGTHRVTRELLRSFCEQIAQRQIPAGNLKKNPFAFVAPRSAQPKPISTQPVNQRLPEHSSSEQESYERTLATFRALHLQSVMMGRSGRMAIISNNVLSVGERIEMFTIKAIESDAVVLTWQGKAFVLKMSP